MRITDAVRDARAIGRLLTAAEAEARQGGEERPGPEHLVLAATCMGEDSAARALQQVGTDAPALRGALEEARRAALSAVGVDLPRDARTASALQAPARGVHRSTPQGQEVFQEAVTLSKGRTPSRLRGADVVAAACRMERGAFVRALHVLGVDREALRQAAEAAARAT